MKKNDVFLFVISHLIPEIFKIFVLCKLDTDDVIRCDNKSKHKIENISASYTAVKLKVGEHVIAYEIHQMVYILMLLWQRTQFQIAIMQKWLPLYLILSRLLS